MSGPVLGIDPGTRKCGFAVVPAANETPLELGIVPTEAFGASLAALVARFAPRAIALGGGTFAGQISALASELGVPVAIVDERETTLLARRRYFAAHPPRGWRRIVPLGMLVPPRPIDDFAALLIAERFLATEAATEAGLAGSAATEAGPAGSAATEAGPEASLEGQDS